MISEPACKDPPVMTVATMVNMIFALNIGIMILWFFTVKMANMFFSFSKRKMLGG